MHVISPLWVFYIHSGYRRLCHVPIVGILPSPGVEVWCDALWPWMACCWQITVVCRPSLSRYLLPQYRRKGGKDMARQVALSTVGQDCGAPWYSMIYPHEPCFEGVLYQGPGDHSFPGRSRRVSVLVDNRFDQRTHPVHQLKFDWYQEAPSGNSSSWRVTFCGQKNHPLL